MSDPTMRLEKIIEVIENKKLFSDRDYQELTLEINNLSYFIGNRICCKEYDDVLEFVQVAEALIKKLEQITFGQTNAQRVILISILSLAEVCKGYFEELNKK